MPNEAATGHSPSPEALNQQSTHPQSVAATDTPLLRALLCGQDSALPSCSLLFLPSRTQKQQPAFSRLPKSTQRLLGKQERGIDKMQAHWDHLASHSKCKAPQCVSQPFAPWNNMGRSKSHRCTLLLLRKHQAAVLIDLPRKRGKSFHGCTQYVVLT